MKLDLKKIEVNEMEINYNDYPDFTDSFILSASYEDRELSDEELDWLNEDSDFIYEMVIERLF